MRPQPLIVSLYGGPGTGKSTVAALVFGALKQRGVNVEFVSEIAKGFTWEERWSTLTNQPYVIAKQLRDYDRLYGKVDCIVTDTSSLLGLIYMDPEMRAAAFFKKWVVRDWQSRDTLNVFLERNEDGEYQTSGRKETNEEAVALDNRIKTLLQYHCMPTLYFPAYGHVDAITEEIMERLDPDPSI